MRKSFEEFEREVERERINNPLVSDLYEAVRDLHALLSDIEQYHGVVQDGSTHRYISQQFKQAHQRYEETMQRYQEGTKEEQQ